MGVGIDRRPVLQLLSIYIVGRVGGGLCLGGNEFSGRVFPYQLDRYRVEHLG